MSRKKPLVKVHQDISYKAAHLHSLPYEILVEIFQYLHDDLKSLLLLSLTCSKFNSIVNKNLMYREVRLNGVRNFRRFTSVHIPMMTLSKRFSLSSQLLQSQQQQLNPSSKINLIYELEVSNPPTKAAGNVKTTIAGSYNIEGITGSNHSKDTDHKDYVNSLVNILRESYSLKILVISEISPLFSFPESHHHELSPSSGNSFFLSWKHRNPPKRSLDKLVLKSQSGWSIPFKYSHISSLFEVYDTIEELVLYNFVIDESKLQAPVTTKKPIIINKLTLLSCTFLLPTNRTTKRKPCDIFLHISHLQLYNISSGKDLSVIDFIKTNNMLSKITIDFTSPVFYGSSATFNFARYNLFFKLLCSGSGAYSNLKELEFINFTLLDSHGHLHQVEKADNNDSDQERDDWVEPPSDTFESLLRFLLSIPLLTITLKERPEGPMTCVNCGTTKEVSRPKRSYCDWLTILKPLVKQNEKCNVKILGHKGNVLFKKEVES